MQLVSSAYDPPNDISEEKLEKACNIFKFSSESSGMHCHVLNWMSTDVSVNHRPDDGGSTHL
jgi:hypothetical protein